VPTQPSKRHEHALRKKKERRRGGGLDLQTVIPSRTKKRKEIEITFCNQRPRGGKKKKKKGGK